MTPRRLGVLLAALMQILAASALAPAAGAAPIDRLCNDYLSRTITVDVLGDSIMSGSGASDQFHSWSAKLDRILGVNAVRQRANAGSVTTDYLPGGRYYSQTWATMASAPTVVVMDWRLNEHDGYVWNLPGGADPFQLRDNLIRLINHIHSASPTTTVLIVNPPIVFDGRDIDLQRQYVAGMWVAKDVTNSLWLDLALYFPASAAENDLGLLGPDLIHPGNPGQAVIATAVHQRLHGTCAR